MPSFIYNDIAFIHVPKTGGTSISSLINIEDFFIKKYINIIKEKEHLLLLHAPASLVKHYENCKTMIAFVRNPYTRFISIFCMSKNMRIHNFDISIEGIKQFCKFFLESTELKKSIIFKPMTYFIYDEKNNCLVDHILHFENFSNDIIKLCNIMNINIPSEIPIITKNMYFDNSDYMSWYDEYPELYNFVNNIYQEDFKAFNYPIINVKNN